MGKEIKVMNTYAGVGAGKLRRPFRIREFLAGKGLTMSKIAEDLGLHHSVVGYTVKGIKNNKRVLDYLHDLGCPEEFLSRYKEKMPKQDVG